MNINDCFLPALVLYVLWVIVYSVIYTILIFIFNFTTSKFSLNFTIPIGLLTGMILIIILICHIIKYFVISYREKRRIKRWAEHNKGELELKEPKPNIFIEFIKATYNKYCPNITWVEEEKTNN